MEQIMTAESSTSFSEDGRVKSIKHLRKSYFRVEIPTYRR